MQHNNIPAALRTACQWKKKNTNIPLMKQQLKVYKCGWVHTAKSKQGYYDLTDREKKNKVMGSSTTDVYAKE